MLEFVREDLGFEDVTSESTLQEERARARVLAKECGVLAGLEEARLLLEHIGADQSSEKSDGGEFAEGEEILSFSGRAKSLLAVERVLLNTMMRMSGVATLARRAVKIAEKYGVEVACTRKTTPGFGYFEKKAAKLGGAQTHRFHLDDLILIKDNHLALVGMERAVGRAKRNFTKKVEVEVKSIEQALKACELGADIVMLDNFSPGEVEEALRLIKQRGWWGTVEVSGGVTRENLEDYASLKPDVVSMGELTRAEWIDMSIELEPESL